MKRAAINKLILLLVVIFLAFEAKPQSGMVKNENYTGLIPMLENNQLIGHAFVYLLDKVNKDSTSYVVQVLDDYLHDVGKTKIILPSNLTFKKISFNGKNILTKFENEKGSLFRYIVFNQKADLIFDSLFHCIDDKLDITEGNTFISTATQAVNQVGVLDYFHTKGKNDNLAQVNFINMSNSIWNYNYPIKNANLNYLFADNHYVVNQATIVNPSNKLDRIKTNIVMLDIQTGKLLFETTLFKNDSISIYPIAASINGNKIEIISSFTKQFAKYARVKYGICIHELDLTGNVLQSNFNELTQSLVNDTLAINHGLFTTSYLYMHKAVKLSNGNWLLAAEQLKQPTPKVGFFSSSKQTYLKKSICLFEINPKAEITMFHLESNDEEDVLVKRHFATRPQQGGMVLESNNRLDVNYFIQDTSKSKNRFSYVFTDVYASKHEISLGDILYDNGKISVDKFSIPLLSSSTRVMVLPARFGNAYLFKFDKYFGLADFDMIRFVH